MLCGGGEGGVSEQVLLDPPRQGDCWGPAPDLPGSWNVSTSPTKSLTPGLGLRPKGPLRHFWCRKSRTKTLCEGKGT